jgi:hypothetical protein
MLCRVAFVRTEVSEKCIAFIISMTRIRELGTKLAVQVTLNFVPSSPILVILMMEAIFYSEMSALTRATRRNTPEDGILLRNNLF